MTKQQEIREKQDKILNLVKVWAVIKHPYESRDAEGLLYSLAQEGVMIKMDRKLPRFGIGENLVAVEPLIKEN